MVLEPLQVILDKSHPSPVLLQESLMAVGSAIVQIAKILQTCTSENLRWIRQSCADKDLYVSDMGIMGHTQEPPIQSDDPIVDQCSTLDSGKGPAF